MKKQVALLFLFSFLFSISLVSTAPTLTLQHEDIQPGETLFGTISVSNSEEFTKTISSSDIEFFKNRKKIFIEHDITFYNDKFYFYAYMREGNFTLKINNILYKSGETIKETTLEKNLTIKENPEIIQEERINATNGTYYENITITKILSVKPGFFFGTNELEFTLENKGISELNISYNNGANEIPLSPEQNLKITPSISQNTTLSFLEFLTYKNFSVPIIYLSSEEIDENLILELKPGVLYLHVNLIAGQEQTETIGLFNFIEQNITDISITSNISIMEITNKDELETIGARATKNISLTFNSEQEGFIEGEILVTYSFAEQEKNFTIPIFAYILPENSSQEDLENFEFEEFTELQNECESMNGTICSVGTVCTEQETYLGNSVYCCLTACESTSGNGDGDDDETSYGWLIGLLILIVLGVAGFFAYKKFKKTKPQKPEEKLQETGKLYEKRISGELTRT
tara:strand:+ start:760 stop:2142 length:1383 start_codon:yes stop_codon:yes gene_type:complete